MWHPFPKRAIALLFTISLINCSDIITDEVSLPNDSITRAGQQSTTYYWYGDKKIEIGINPQKIFVVFDENYEKNISSKTIKNYYNTDAMEDDIRILDISGCMGYKENPSSKILSKKLWTTNLLREDVQMLTPEEGLFYKAPFYIMQSGEEFPASNFFYVKLHDEGDLPKLEKLASDTGVEVINQNAVMRLWWTLSCDITSAGNSVEMSNYFYETGMFAGTAPDFMSAEPMAGISDPYYSEQWNLPIINYTTVNNITKGAGVEIAIVDTGIQRDHPDLKPELAPLLNYDASTGTFGSDFSTGLTKPNVPVLSEHNTTI